jgi:hypothetical protein
MQSHNTRDNFESAEQPSQTQQEQQQQPQPESMPEANTGPLVRFFLSTAQQGFLYDLSRMRAAVAAGVHQHQPHSQHATHQQQSNSWSLPAAPLVCSYNYQSDVVMVAAAVGSPLLYALTQQGVEVYRLWAGHGYGQTSDIESSLSAPLLLFQHNYLAPHAPVPPPSTSTVIASPTFPSNPTSSASVASESASAARSHHSTASVTAWQRAWSTPFQAISAVDSAAVFGTALLLTPVPHAAATTQHVWWTDQHPAFVPSVDFETRTSMRAAAATATTTTTKQTNTTTTVGDRQLVQPVTVEALVNAELERWTRADTIPAPLPVSVDVAVQSTRSALPFNASTSSVKDVRSDSPSTSSSNKPHDAYLTDNSRARSSVAPYFLVVWQLASAFDTGARLLHYVHQAMRVYHRRPKLLPYSPEPSSAHLPSLSDISAPTATRSPAATKTNTQV